MYGRGVSVVLFWCTMIYQVTGGLGGGLQYFINLHQHQFGAAQDTDGRAYLVLLNTGATTANVAVQNFRNPAWLDLTFPINPGDTYTVSIQASKLMVTAAGNADRHIIDVTSDVELIMFVYNKVISNTASDAFLALPNTAAADVYYVLVYRPTQNTDPEYLTCSVTVMPTMSDSTITYTMPQNAVTLFDGTINGRDTFVAFETVSQTVTYQTLHFFQSSSDLTGMKISSSTPVHVIAATKTGFFYDGLELDLTEEAMPEVKTWGIKYVVVAQNIGYDRLWVMTSEPNTKIRINAGYTYCSAFTVNIAGGYVDYLIETEHAVIIGDKPINVAHYIVTPNMAYSMYMVTPVEQYLSDAAVYVPSSLGTYTVTLAIITYTSMTDGVMLDGAPVNGNWSHISNWDMSVISVTVTSDVMHKIQHTTPSGVFGGYVSGSVVTESFSSVLMVRTRDLLTGCAGGSCLDNSSFGLLSCVPPPPVAPEGSCPLNNTIYLGEEFMKTVAPDLLERLSASAPDPNNGSCTCFCADYGYTDELSLEAKIAVIKLTLTVDPTDTGAYQRTKTSARDNRPSSISMGSLCAVALIAFVSIMMLSDIRMVVMDLRQCRKIVRKNMKDCEIRRDSPGNAKHPTDRAHQTRFEAEINNLEGDGDFSDPEFDGDDEAPENNSPIEDNAISVNENTSTEASVTVQS